MDMGFRRALVIGVGLAGVGASAAAAVILWLVVTDPMAVAIFVAGGR